MELNCIKEIMGTFSKMISVITQRFKGSCISLFVEYYIIWCLDSDVVEC